MDKAFIQESTLTAIANAIRSRNESEDTYLPSEMAQAIVNIPAERIVKSFSPIDLVSAKADSIKSINAFGKTEQNGTPTPISPVDIVCNNGALKLVPNLWSVYEYAYLDQNGIAVAISGFGCTDYIPVNAGEEYSLYADVYQTYSSNGLRICFYDIDKTFIPPRQGDNATSVGKYLSVGTAPANAKYMRCSCGINPSWIRNIMLKKGAWTTSTIKTAIYTDGNQETLQLGTDTATCERLLSLNGYTDTQEILSGIVNRKIGIKVLDGSESWVLSSGDNDLYYTPDITNNAVGDGVPSCYSTHFIGEITTVNGQTQRNESIKVGYSAFDYTAHRLYLKSNNFNSDTEVLKSWLQTQYNNGTPVIIVYPLATPVTDRDSTDQTMQTVAGDNILEITQASLDDLMLETEYLRTVNNN